jgi:O-antigen ligase
MADTENRPGWRETAWLVAAGGLVAVATLLGGASLEPPVRLTLVELASVPLLAMSLDWLVHHGPPPGSAVALILLGLALAVPAMQLLPLPPFLWTRLAGRGIEVQGLNLAGIPLPWAPISLAPRQTLVSALALAPPVAMFLAALRLGGRARRRLVVLWLVLAVAGLILGVAQIAGAGAASFYPYAITNEGSLVGFFANRNHEAGFLLALLPLGAAMVADRHNAGSLAIWFLGLLCFLAVVGLGAVRSRAGVILAGPAMVASLAIVWRARQSTLPRRGLVVVGAGATAGLAAVLIFGFSPIAERFHGSVAGEFRLVAWPYVERAAVAFLPMGAGIGAFDRVFRSVEPMNLVGPTFFNHAHNDYLELWLETGVAGPGLLAVFILWLVWKTWVVWTSRTGAGLGRGASVAIGLILSQSLVDYPLRTVTMATLFAFCCGLLAQPSLAMPALECAAKAHRR